MTTQTEGIRALLETATDEDVVVNFTDGASDNLGSHRAILEDQLAISEYADKVVAFMKANSIDAFLTTSEADFNKWCEENL